MGRKAANVDWKAIEADYTAGVTAVRRIAADHGIDESAIRQRAKAEGWIRQEPVRVRRIAQQKADDAGLPRVPVDPEERIQELGSVAGEVLVAHRKQLVLMRTISKGLADELLAANESRDQLEERIIEYYSAKAAMSPTQAAAYRKQMNDALAAISLGARSKTMLNLASATKIIVELERTNYKLDEQTGEKTYEQLLAEIHAKVFEG